MSPTFIIRPADLDDPRDVQTVVQLLDQYAREPMGQGKPLAAHRRQRLACELPKRSDVWIALAFWNDEPAGIAVCFEGYSTFRAAPLLNIHDLFVVPARRRCGIARRLLHAVEQEARRRACAWVTLEVRTDNHSARRLYQAEGYRSGDGASYAEEFWKLDLASDSASTNPASGAPAPHPERPAQ